MDTRDTLCMSRSASDRPVSALRNPPAVERRERSERSIAGAVSRVAGGGRGATSAGGEARATAEGTLCCSAGGSSLRGTPARALGCGAAMGGAVLFSSRLR